MVFSSSVFLLLFLPIVIIAYYLIFRKSRKAQNIFLFIASMLFYAWGEPALSLVMLLSIVWNWGAGLIIDKYKANHRVKKLVLIIACVLNISLLFVFKYLMFTLENINLLLGTTINIPDIVLPIGISFFTFQGMSYVFDVYMKKGKVQRNLLNVGLYISFFPQLVAGPIVRYDLIAEQIENRRESLKDVSEGVSRFVIGLSKKVIFADLLAVLADTAFEDGLFASGVYGSSTLMAWLGAIAYTLQIYFDFSGYSDMAIGLGKMFGFRFEENFNYPYISKNMTDFWRRWHISLSSWFRDYVYIPLGGNRGTLAKTVFNMGIVWLLTGIWHGANWTFIAWGLLHFVVLAIEKLTHFDKKSNVLTRIYTIIIIVVGWVIFRADNLSQAGIFIGGMFGASSGGFANETSVSCLTKYAVILALAIFASTDVVKRLSRKISGKKWYNAARAAAIVLLFAISFIYILNQTYSPFIYFNF